MASPRAASQGLAGDGVYQYAYDAWNRLRKVQRVAAHSGQADDVTTIAEYVYLADNRRASKVVSHCGPQATPGYEDGGDTTVHFYYSNKWQILETRNGSNQSTRQWVWGKGGMGVSPVNAAGAPLMDVTLDPPRPPAADRPQGGRAASPRAASQGLAGSPSFSNNCDPDVGDQGQGEDRRYFYHQDRNWNVVGLTEYDDGVGTDARVVERYAYTPYGEFIVLSGDSGSGELGAARATSSVGNPFFHQGLCFDEEKGSYQNRWRDYRPERFAQRDPQVNGTLDGPSSPRWPGGEAGRHPGVWGLRYADGLSLYLYERGVPSLGVDPAGLACAPPNGCSFSPDQPLGFNFKPCCDGHDTCYCTCGKEKTTCDQGFLGCLLDYCEHNYWVCMQTSPWTWSCDFESSICRGLAYTYGSAVTEFGLDAYCDAQRAEDCCLPPECK